MPERVRPPVTRRERIETTAMEPLLDGGVRERTYDAYAWRCDTCGLVWEKKHQAQDCTARGHKSRYQQGPYGNCWIENGVLRGNPIFYTRVAIRREPVED